MGARDYLVTLVLCVSLTNAAETSKPASLHGHVPPAVTRSHRIDRLGPIEQLDLAIGLPLRHPEALTNLLRQLYNPAATNFHRYLTPEQFTAKFGPTEEEYQSVIQFAQNHELTITARHPNRMLLNVRGSVDKLEQAFRVQMGVYWHPEENRTFYAPDVEPSVETGVRVLHVSGLNNYRLPQPRYRESVARPSGGQPRAGSGPSGSFLGDDFRKAYVPGTSLSGAGQMVGLFELDGYYASDITSYRTQAGLTNVPLQNVLIDGFNGNPTGHRPGSGNEEVSLDIEMVISMAPGLSKVLVYEASPTSTMANVNHLLNRMATDNLAKQLSCSWGFDIDLTTQQILQQYAAQGQSFFLASGDSGAFAEAVTQPSDNPYVTVVGGTVLSTDSAGAWLSETAWVFAGGGISTLYGIPDWQAGIDLSASQGSTTMRNVPDVAMVAENVWAVVDRGSGHVFSGTSIAAPLWAAFTALVNEQGAANSHPPVGFLNPALYALGRSPVYTNVFHDVVSGSNTNDSSPAQFAAVPGFDLVTGWGTPNGTNLINALLADSPEKLLLTPPLGFVAAGSVGGPFSVTAQTYGATNTGSAPLEWSAGSSAPWLTVNPVSGTLAPGGPSASVAVGLNAAATNLLLGEFNASVLFTNLSTGSVQSRPFRLLVGNGGFEAGDFTDWTLSAQRDVTFVDSLDTSIFSGRPSIPGIDDQLFVHSGIYGAFLGQNTTLGSMSKTVPTVPDQTYLFSFWLDNPASGIPNAFSALWDGTLVFDGADMDAFAWTNLQFTVTATLTNTLLEFRFRNDENAFGLDDIRVQAISNAQPPEVVSLQAAVGGTTLHLGITGAANSQYTLQGSSDLQTWVDVQSVTTDSSGATEVRINTLASTLQFFRIVSPP